MSSSLLVRCLLCNEVLKCDPFNTLNLILHIRDFHPDISIDLNCKDRIADYVNDLVCHEAQKYAATKSDGDIRKNSKEKWKYLPPKNGNVVDENQKNPDSNLIDDETNLQLTCKQLHELNEKMTASCNRSRRPLNENINEKIVEEFQNNSPENVQNPACETLETGEEINSDKNTKDQILTPITETLETDIEANDCSTNDQNKKNTIMMVHCACPKENLLDTETSPEDVSTEGTEKNIPELVLCSNVDRTTSTTSIATQNHMKFIHLECRIVSDSSNGYNLSPHHHRKTNALSDQNDQKSLESVFVSALSTQNLQRNAHGCNNVPKANTVPAHQESPPPDNEPQAIYDQFICDQNLNRTQETSDRLRPCNCKNNPAAKEPKKISLGCAGNHLRNLTARHNRRKVFIPACKQDASDAAGNDITENNLCSKKDEVTSTDTLTGYMSPKQDSDQPNNNQTKPKTKCTHNNGEMHAVYRRKYIVKKPLQQKTKYKLYKTSIERWRPGTGRICCPTCGTVRRPIIKSRAQKTSTNSIGAACILTCWPLCFLPCLFPPPAKEYLYCSVCKTFLGSYNYSTAVVEPNLDCDDADFKKDPIDTADSGSMHL